MNQGIQPGLEKPKKKGFFDKMFGKKTPKKTNNINQQGQMNQQNMIQSGVQQGQMNQQNMGQSGS